MINMTGKEKCKLLKEIRIQIAKTNGIEFSTVECKQQGECIGTCPRCEAEAKTLDNAIDTIINTGGRITIPDTYYQMIDFSTVPLYGIRSRKSAEQKLNKTES